MKQKKLTGIPKNIPKNKVNQKELSQIKKYFSSLTKIETKLWTKSTRKPKNKDYQGGSHLIYSQARPSLINVLRLHCA